MWIGTLIAGGLAVWLSFGLNFHWFLAWLLSINLLAFIVYGADKELAKRGKRRISENALLFYTLIGGTAGATTGMKLFRHKTQKTAFRRWYWAIVALQALLLGLWIWSRLRR